MTSFAERHYRSLIITIWLMTSLLFFLVSRDAIANWKMGDPDDQLRLVAGPRLARGQSWWDVTQYRMNLPDGGPMHLVPACRYSDCGHDFAAAAIFGAIWR